MLDTPSPPSAPPEYPRTIPDPGTPGMAFLALISLFVFIGGTFVLQQMKAAQPSPAQAAPGLAAPDQIDDPFVLSSKLVVKVGRAMSGVGGQPTSTSTLSAQSIGAARDAHERFRAAVVVGELEGAPRAIDQFLRLRTFLETPHQTTIDEAWVERPSEGERVELLRDIELAQVLLEQGPVSLPAADADRLLKRHGWFGSLLTTSGLPDTDPARAPLVRNGPALIILLVVALLGGGLVIVGGCVAFVFAVAHVIKKGMPRRFVPPAPGGSVYLETAALFFASFLVLKFVTDAVGSSANISPSRAVQFALAAQWLILPVIFWPIVRGVPARAHFRMIGLHTGQGVFREIVAGLFGYLAGIPIMILAVLVSAILIIGKGLLGGNAHGGGAPASPPENPIIGIVTQGGVTVVMLYALATVWAPIVEESVFRGALLRHLRARMPLVVAAIVSAVAFALAHGYEWMALGPVFAIGFNFAIIREWRGSLIAPIVAHALHNGTVLAILITMVSLLN